MNENEDLIDRHSPKPDPADDANSDRSSVNSSEDPDQKMGNLPPYDFDDKMCAPSAQTTLYSLDSATKQFLERVNMKQTSFSACSCMQCEDCAIKAETRSRITISRQAYNMEEFDQTFDRKKRTSRKKTPWCRPPNKPTQDGMLAIIYRVVPLFSWIQSYTVSDLNADFWAGFTIAIFTIPQCMGYSLLAGVPPIYGLYTSFLTPIIYGFFGTSKHASIGTFAIISLMTGSVISELAGSNGFTVGQSEIEIAAIMAFLIGVYQLLFSVCRLGYLAQFMSEQLTSGFICASAVYVLSSQLGYITGIKNLTSSGTKPFGLINFYINLGQRIRTDSNLVEISISLLCILLLAFWKFYLLGLCASSRLAWVRSLKHLPSELLLVSSSIVTSWFFDFHGNFKVAILGEIPNGLPSFVMPSFRRIIDDQLWLKCISLAIVAFAVTYSTAVTFAQKHAYTVKPNQELFALAATNTAASFFNCLPSAASLSRSAIAETVGARSQIAGFINSGIILVVLLFLSPLLTFLPKCVLASIICVALKSLFLKAVDCKKYCKLDKIDGSIWLVSFLGVIILNVDYGLYLGLGYSLLTLIAKSQRPKTYMLGVVGNTNVYVPLSHYRTAQELSQIRIFQFCGPLHFANVSHFKSRLAEKAQLKSRSSNSTVLPFAIVIDCSMFSYIDATGISAIKNVVKLYQMQGVKVFLSEVATHVRAMMASDTGFHVDVPMSLFFITTHDAICAVHQAREEEMCASDSAMDESGIEDESPKSGTPENPFVGIDMDREESGGEGRGGGGSKVKKKEKEGQMEEEEEEEEEEEAPLVAKGDQNQV